jgi:hypothetical protein
MLYPIGYNRGDENETQEQRNLDHDSPRHPQHEERLDED